MTLIQLEYMLAIMRLGSFRAAAEKMSVSQPALSLQLHNLEQELGGRLLDRSKKPIQTTELGERIAAQARIVVAEAGTLKAIAREDLAELEGELRAGIIPTVAPYLVPRFLRRFTDVYPKVKLTLSEMTTGEIIKELKAGDVDCGILATPLHEPGIQERALYHESFVVYLHPDSQAAKNRTVCQTDMEGERIWLLKDGHCFKSQVLQVCSQFLRPGPAAVYEAGSIETLKRLVDQEGGMTILPEMAVETSPESELEHIRYFQEPEPMREVGLAIYRHQTKDRLVKALQECILGSLPEKYKTMRAEGAIIQPILQSRNTFR